MPADKALVLAHIRAASRSLTQMVETADAFLSPLPENEFYTNRGYQALSEAIRTSVELRALLGRIHQILE